MHFTLPTFLQRNTYGSNATAQEAWAIETKNTLGEDWPQQGSNALEKRAALGSAETITLHKVSSFKQKKYNRTLTAHEANSYATAGQVVVPMRLRHRTAEERKELREAFSTYDNPNTSRNEVAKNILRAYVMHPEYLAHTLLAVGPDVARNMLAGHQPSNLEWEHEVPVATQWQQHPTFKQNSFLGVHLSPTHHQNPTYNLHHYGHLIKDPQTHMPNERFKAVNRGEFTVEHDTHMLFSMFPFRVPINPMYRPQFESPEDVYEFLSEEACQAPGLAEYLASETSFFETWGPRFVAINQACPSGVHVPEYGKAEQTQLHPKINQVQKCFTGNNAHKVRLRDELMADIKKDPMLSQPLAFITRAPKGWSPEDPEGNLGGIFDTDTNPDLDLDLGPSGTPTEPMLF